MPSIDSVQPSNKKSKSESDRSIRYSLNVSDGSSAAEEDKSDGQKPFYKKPWLIALTAAIIIILSASGATAGYLLGWWGEAGNIADEGKKASLFDKDDISPGGLPLNPDNVSPISGIACENYDARPVAVMMPSDVATRPQSGFAEADLVVEMPVLASGVTRLMAVYVCGEPEAIGSIRSARHDYIWLALGYDAIFAHWGGSYIALNLLRSDGNIRSLIDDLDALGNPHGAFYRTTDKPAPHNGFTSMDRIRSAATALGFRAENKFEGYPHTDELALDQRPEQGELTVGYPGRLAVRYEYDKETNSYQRFWGGTSHMDKNTGTQNSPKVVVVVRAGNGSYPGPGGYNEVDIEGSGEVVVYQNGQVIEGTWSKDAVHKQSKLYFRDSSGQEIRFVPGQIWLEIIEPFRDVTWAAEASVTEVTPTYNSGSDLSEPIN